MARPLNSSAAVVASTSSKLNKVGQLDQDAKAHLLASQSAEQLLQQSSVLRPVKAKDSAYHSLVKPATDPRPPEEARKLFVTKISRQVSDDFMERILKCFGQLTSWKRRQNSSGEPMAFGFAEYSRIHEVYQCYRVLNGQELMGQALIVKPDQTGIEAMTSWKNSKIDEFCERNPRESREELQNLSIQSEDGGKNMTTFEKSLFENYEGVMRLFGETVEKKELIEEVAKEQYERQEEQRRLQALNGKGTGDSIYMDADPLNRHKETLREIQREEKILKFDKEREEKFSKKLKDWLEHENYVREQKRKNENYDREKFLDELVEKELRYDESEVKKKKKKDPRAFAKEEDDRRRIREKERKDDEDDRKREKEELRVLDEKRKEEERKTQEKKRKEEELKERLKQQRFIQFKETIERQEREEEENRKKEEALKKEEEDKIQQKTSQKKKINVEVSEHSRKRLREIEEENEKQKKNKVSEYLTDEEKRKQLEQIKKIYQSLPKGKEELFEEEIEWTRIAKLDLIEKNLRGWVGKQVEANFGVEEPSIVKLLLSHLNKRPKPDVYIKKIEPAYGKTSEEFVLQLWKRLAFESRKLQAGIVPQ